MTTHRVPATSLSVLFDTNVEVERMPEPFRLQPDLVLSIPYSEYLSFVHSLSRDSVIDLYPSTQVVLEQLQAQSIKNYQSYLLNVAFAICKELHFATVYEMAPTIILPSSETAKGIPWRLYLHSTEKAWSGDTSLYSLLDFYGLQFRPVTQLSQQLWNLATGIFKVSKNLSAEGVLNLTM